MALQWISLYNVCPYHCDTIGMSTKSILIANAIVAALVMLSNTDPLHCRYITAILLLNQSDPPMCTQCRTTEAPPKYLIHPTIYI